MCTTRSGSCRNVLLMCIKFTTTAAYHLHNLQLWWHLHHKKGKENLVFPLPALSEFNLNIPFLLCCVYWGYIYIKLSPVHSLECINIIINMYKIRSHPFDLFIPCLIKKAIKQVRKQAVGQKGCQTSCQGRRNTCKSVTGSGNHSSLVYHRPAAHDVTAIYYTPVDHSSSIDQRLR